MSESGGEVLVFGDYDANAFGGCASAFEGDEFVLNVAHDIFEDGLEGAGKKELCGFADLATDGVDAKAGDVDGGLHGDG